MHTQGLAFLGAKEADAASGYLSVSPPVLFFFLGFDQVQASLLLVIRKVRCRGNLAALRAPVMVAYLWVEASQESFSQR